MICAMRCRSVRQRHQNLPSRNLTLTNFSLKSLHSIGPRKLLRCPLPLTAGTTPGRASNRAAVPQQHRLDVLTLFYLITIQAQREDAANGDMDEDNFNISPTNRRQSSAFIEIEPVAAKHDRLPSRLIGTDPRRPNAATPKSTDKHHTAVHSAPTRQTQLHPLQPT